MNDREILSEKSEDKQAAIGCGANRQKFCNENPYKPLAETRYYHNLHSCEQVMNMAREKILDKAVDEICVKYGL